MKRKIIQFAFVIAALVSITTGCAVHGGYDHYEHRGINNHDHYNH